MGDPWSVSDESLYWETAREVLGHDPAEDSRWMMARFEGMGDLEGSLGDSVNQRCALREQLIAQVWGLADID